jgi:hypothetical protein
LVELKIVKGKKGEGVSISSAKKTVTINSEGGSPALEITNEYGNSVRYEISGGPSFDGFFANLWQFVKDSQH